MFLAHLRVDVWAFLVSTWILRFSSMTTKCLAPNLFCKDQLQLLRRLQWTSRLHFCSRGKVEQKHCQEAQRTQAFESRNTQKKREHLEQLTQMWVGVFGKKEKTHFVQNKKLNDWQRDRCLKSLYEKVKRLLLKTIMKYYNLYIQRPSLHSLITLLKR